MNADKAPAEQEASSHSLALGVAVAAGFIAAIMRIVPHPPNFSSVGALGLFGGARLRAWQAYLLPLAIMILSDLLLWVLTGFDFKYSLGHLSRVFVYASFMIYVFIGRWLRDTNSVTSIMLAATLGGVQFFVLTNFCEWLFQPWQPGIPAAYLYTRDLSGLITCFAYALPFYDGTLPYVDHPFMLFTDFRLSLIWTCLGDVIFSTVYFLAHARLVKLASSARMLPVPVTNS